MKSSASIPNAPSTQTLSRLAAVIGPRYALDTPEAMVGYLKEPRDRYHGEAALVLRPQSTTEVSQILAIANETRTAIVPQSGNTGLVGGQVPFESGNEVVLSLDRMKAIRHVDAGDNTITLDAGVTLHEVHEAALSVDRQFPLHLASQGSCMIGGNLASNAGGIGVLAWGNARDLCLGLEVVLADGRVWNGLRRLHKDNTGYDMKHLFIGSEGTLGIITGAVLKLFPKSGASVLAFCGVPEPAAALEVLNLARSMTQGQVTACELVPRIGLEFTMQHADARDPLETRSDWYLLLELSSASPDSNLDAGMESILENAFERGLVSDATIAASQAQADALWHIRESLSDVQRLEGGSIKHDIAVPLAMVPEFIAQASRAATQLVPGARPVPFGHLGDGNIHFNVSQPEGGDKATFLAGWNDMSERIHRIALDMGGTISAEHGIGRMKRDKMAEIKPPVELDMMRSLKAAFDPLGILNPGKLLPEGE